jgi:hypothetical protein
MKLILATMALGGLLRAGAAPETFTGVITDTMCGVKHGMLKDQPDDQCIKSCVKGSSGYALFDGKNVLKLSDQKNPAKYAAQRVKVTSVYNASTKTIKVGSIEPAGEAH